MTICEAPMTIATAKATPEVEPCGRCGTTKGYIRKDGWKPARQTATVGGRLVVVCVGCANWARKTAERASIKAAGRREPTDPLAIFLSLRYEAARVKPGTAETIRDMKAFEVYLSRVGRLTVGSIDYRWATHLRDIDRHDNALARRRSSPGRKAGVYEPAREYRLALPLSEGEGRGVFRVGSYGGPLHD